MKRTSGRIGIGLVLVSMLAGACFTDREERPVSAEATIRTEATLPDVRNAQEVVVAVRAQIERSFGKTNAGALASTTSASPPSRFDLLGAANPENEVVVGPELPLKAPVFKARVALPARADGAFHLVDERSNVSIDVALMGATTAPREEADGYVVYRNGYADGAHIVHRATSQGTEDYVFFPEKLPATPALRYELALGENVAGLRLIEGTLEMLDKGGAPRLRMNPPYAIDGDGKRIELRVSIADCAYDSSGAMPWGRPTVSPGSQRCTVHLTWDGSVKAPLVVDPEWALTLTMKSSRTHFTATPFGSGKVIVAGGESTTNAQLLGNLEYYDHSTISWSPGPAMPTARADHAAVLATISGANYLYMIGGRSPDSKSVEKFDFNQGKWITGVPPMLTGHQLHTATNLPNRGILVVGGGDSGGGQATAAAEFYDYTLQTPEWFAAPLNRARVGHTATALTDTTVLVVGGNGVEESPTTAEIFNANSQLGSQWTLVQLPTASVNGHAFHTATKTVDNRVVIAGGQDSTGAPITAVDIFNVSNNSFEQGVPAMSTARTLFGAGLLPSGKDVIVMGGKANGDPTSAFLKSTEVLKIGATKWEAYPDMKEARANFRAVTLGSGYIMAIGGTATTSGVGGTAEFFGCSTDTDCQVGGEILYCAADHTCKSPKSDGQACDVRGADQGGNDCAQASCGVCKTGNCVDGVCCNGECSGQCERCNEQGQCVPVSGSPVTNKEIGNEHLPKRNPCTEHEVCGGTCNGTRTDMCTYEPKGTTCNTACTSDTLETTVCNGKGECNLVFSKELCSPYTCDDSGEQCASECTPANKDMGTLQLGCDKTSECTTDGYCFPRPTSCIDDNTALLSDGDPQPCGNYRCDPEEGRCFTECKSVYDCMPSDPNAETQIICDDGYKCVPRTFEKTAEIAASCSTSPGNESSRFGWLAALALAGVFASRRNRSRA